MHCTKCIITGNLGKDIECIDSIYHKINQEDHNILELTPETEPLNVKMAEDFLCIINGMDIANNGNLLLADWNNKKVKVFSPDHKLNLTVPLTDNPFAIAVINDKTAAVSTNDKSLHILDIERSNSIQIQSLYTSDI